MAGTFNAVILLGRVTRDPESVSFPNGGGVVKLGFVVDEAKKNPQTGAWEDKPVWLDVEAFKNADGKGPASVIERFVHKGDRLFVEGRLRLDEWNDKTSGEKRSKLKIVVDKVTLVERKGERDEATSPARRPDSACEEPGAPDEDIPF